MNKVFEAVAFRTNPTKFPPMIVSRYEQQLVWDAILEEYKRLEKCINPILKTIRLHACTFRIVLLSPVIIISTIVLCFTNQGKPFFFKALGRTVLFFRSSFKTMNDKKNLDGV
jgi:lipopolysaccharide/colanic/teichoic acid biosynthesis glycosyltransferase